MSKAAAQPPLIHVPKGRWSGAGVRIAVVDSGVAADHPRVRGLALGLRAVDAGAEVAWVEDRTDASGHGTLVAAAIRRKALRAELYSLKVFAEEPLTHMRFVLAAIRWAVERGMHVVNLSLGSGNQEHIPGLAAAAELARARGTLLVAAGEPGPAPHYPADLPGFIGVRADRRCREWSYSVWPGEPLGIGACGLPRRLDQPELAGFPASSFAAAHVTGFLALLSARLGGTAGAAAALAAGAWPATAAID